MHEGPDDGAEAVLYSDDQVPVEGDLVSDSRCTNELPSARHEVENDDLRPSGVQAPGAYGRQSDAVPVSGDGACGPKDSTLRQ